MSAEQATQSRSVSVDLFAPDDLRQAVINAVRRYRACCRQCYAVLLLGQTAGCEIAEEDESLRVNPVDDRGRQVLAAALGKDGAALGYQLRDYFRQQLWPTAMSFVWDSARRDVAQVWTSADPEHPKARRGWLALQGARGVAWFNRRGMGFPRATARPKLDGHTLTLKWDHEIGPVEFRVPKLDGGRYHVWRSLRDGADGWGLGTVYLSERDGRLFACLTHSRPGRAADLDPERVCRVRFADEPDSFLRVVGPDGAATYDSLSAAEAVAWLGRARARREELERRRAACGNPRRPWGHRKGWLATQDVLSRETVQRERRQADTNHAWTRRVASRAESWRCGVVAVEGFPDGLFGHPWQWSQFEQCLRYKLEEIGGTLEVAE